ncbi:MAG: hypothetical protein KAT11_02655 [Phycisphaerae bacterium]|nr:hypothetical protein [Phycisphaerae bacterium]
MDCEREHECLLYLWGEMEQSERVAFVRHVEECPACRGQVESLGPLVQSMQGIEIEELPEEVARRVSGRLAEADESRPRAVRFRTQRVLAVAASIVLVVGVGILWLNTLNKSPGPGGLGAERVEATESLLSDDDYVDALVLVLISEPEGRGEDFAQTEEDILTAAIEDVAYQIEELSQEIEGDFGPIEPSKSGPDEQGSNRAGGKLRMT